MLPQYLKIGPFKFQVQYFCECFGPVSMQPLHQETSSIERYLTYAMLLLDSNSCIFFFNSRYNIFGMFWPSTMQPQHQASSTTQKITHVCVEPYSTHIILPASFEFLGFFFKFQELYFYGCFCPVSMQPQHQETNNIEQYLTHTMPLLVFEY